MTLQQLIELVKEKMTVDEVLKLVEQIAESTNCSKVEALEQVEKARRAAVN